MKRSKVERPEKKDEYREDRSIRRWLTNLNYHKPTDTIRASIEDHRETLRQVSL